MTREEIKNTPELVDFMLDKSVLADSRAKVRERLEEVCNLAIKALEQQPCDTVSRGAFEQVMWERDVAIGQLKELGYGLGQKVEPCDAISRQAVKELFQEACEMKMYDFLGIDDLPSATPQQKYGKWIRIDKDKCKCDQCEVISLIAMYPNGDANYCPNCGAYMRGVE